MKKRKQILSLALALVMALALIPVGALAADTTVSEVAPCQYQFFVEDPAEGMTVVINKESKFGVIDATGKEVVP